MKQTMRELMTKYQAELDDYNGRFFSKWGYRPVHPDRNDFKFLTDKKQRMCLAFWNHVDVTKCTAIIELFAMVLADCKLKSSK